MRLAPISAGNHCENYARIAHNYFLRRFGLSAADVPLLRLDLYSPNPFTLADAPSATRSSTGEVIEVLCLSELSASNVEVAGGRRPSLWVYEGQGNFETVQKTRGAQSSRAPRWDGEAACVSLLPRNDNRVCFDLRDANGPSADPLLLHFGCTSELTADSVGSTFNVLLGQYSIKNKPRATLHFSVRRASPPAPPSPPPPPAPPMPPPSSCHSPWCATFDSWIDDPGSKFMQLWGDTAWTLRARGERGCWEGLGGARFFDDALAGTRCVTVARSEPRRS